MMIEEILLKITISYHQLLENKEAVIRFCASCFATGLEHANGIVADYYNIITYANILSFSHRLYIIMSA